MTKRLKDRRNQERQAPPPEGQKERRGPGPRRQHERVLVDMEVDYKADDTFLFAYITDISAMGIFVRTNNPEPKGTRLNLRFRTPPDAGGELVEVEAEVIWINPVRTHDTEGRNPGMGLRFVELIPQQREQVMRLVRTFAYLNEEDEDEETKGNS